VFVEYDTVCLEIVLLGTLKPPSFCDSMQMHINPIMVLLGPCLVGLASAFLQQGIGNLVVDVLLLEHLLVRELDLAVKVRKSCGLAKAEELVVNEAILEVVKLVNILHNFLTLGLYKLLDKHISVNGNPKDNVAVYYKGPGGEQGTMCAREGSAASRRCAAACISTAEMPLTRILVLSLRSRSGSSLRLCFVSARTNTRHHHQQD
jgi:hypothetical protein